MAVFDCDLASSVKTAGFAKKFPNHFFQGGIQEHNTATIAGAISTLGLLSFFADFGVFGVDETYNQHRLNDINETSLKLICTHNGLDVGEDGKTHQCIDYVGVMQNLFGYKVILPADPNQTDRIIRYISKTHGNFLVAMGRSTNPILLDDKGTPLFGASYEFRYGHADLPPAPVRDGSISSGQGRGPGPLSSLPLRSRLPRSQRGAARDPAAEELRKTCAFLTASYVDTRYPVHWPTHYPREEAQRAYHSAEIVKHWVERRLPSSGSV